MARRVNPPKLGPKPEDLDWWLSKEAGGAREEVQKAFVAKVHESMWDVTEKACLRGMYSDGIAAQTRIPEGDLQTEG